MLTRIDWTLIWIFAAQAVAFSVFWFDKARARAGGRRVPERTLLAVAFLGGIGAWFGQQLLRHKTVKEPFRTWLGVVVAGHLAAVAALIWMVLNDPSPPW